MRPIKQLLLALLCLSVQSASELASRAHAQACPLGKTCFYLPPIQPAPPVAPDSYTDVVIMSAPTQAANYTLQYSAGTPAATTGSVGVGAAPQLSIFPNNAATGFNVAEQRGVMITSDQSDLIVEQRTPALYWQSSSTIRAHTLALGTRFRVAGYSLNEASGDGTGYDFLSLYAPQASTITVTAPTSGPSSFWNGFAGKIVTISLTAGQTYMLRTLTGVEIDATLVTSTTPVSVVVGGRGWGCGAAGDEGADQAVPTALFGQDFVVRRYPAPSLQDVRVLADTDNTHISVNGVQQATINAGGVYVLSGPSVVSLIHADQPVGVFQNAGSTTCENDLAAIPPLSFSNIPSSSLGFRTIGTGYGTVVAPTASIGSLRLDNAVVAASPATVPGRADVSTVVFTLTAGVHKLDINSDVQFGMVSDTGGTGMFAYYNPWRIAGCGNGMLVGTEGCDDGNVDDADGCSSVCGVEPGYSCTGTIGSQSTCVCAADAVCAAGQYCDASGMSNACSAKLANGALLPVQHGSCGGAAGTLGSAASACASGLCNATAGTCAAANSTTCTLASQCVANRCASNNKCGGVDGEDTCSGSSDCQSGNCSAQGGVCVPSPTSCWVDADCASNKFCNRTTFTCQTKLAAGVTLPQDNLHASCPLEQVNSACQSGQCNSVTGTCAAANGASCGTAGECTNNRCGSNGNCGGANGQDSCTVASETTDCQSGHCSAQAQICVPSATSCWVDADCTTDKYCGRSTYTCLAKLDNGTSLPQDGLHANCSDGMNGACVSGLCNPAATSCAGPNATTSCTLASQCAHNRCGSNGSCGGVNGTDSCSILTAAADCQSGYCSETANVCVDGSEGCWVDEDCDSDSYCARSTYVCETKLSNGTQLPQDNLHHDCVTGEENSACESGRCNPETKTCAGENGSATCTEAADCITNRCGSNDKCGGTSGVDYCTPATETIDCQSGQCSANGNRCIDGSSGCWVDADCGSDKYCHRTSYSCLDKLTAGTALPEDDLHESCPDGSLNGACASGRCNAAAHSCAGPNATSGCTAASQCVSNHCGSNGSCGGVNGEDLCTTDSAARDCQSGHCSATAGICVAVASGCWVDADCPNDEFCARDSYTCTTKLSAGSALPHDGLHDACASGDQNAACASGRCNAASKTCAVPHGTGCSDDAQCVGGRCGTDALCGGTSGERCSAPQLCRTNLCGESGVCLPVGGCDSDAGCDDGNYCDLTSLSCKPALGPGAHIPSDHGVCGVATTGAAGSFVRVCASGVCNPVSNTCALSQGHGPCSMANECASNTCASDGQCGQADGSGSCDAHNAPAVCRSGVCSASGVCIPNTPQACWSDSDCASTSYCDRAAFTCRDKLAAGEALPSDGLHASCPESRANAACRLGLCNAATNTCAGPNLSVCTSSAECVWDACDPGDGRCGFARGGECTDETSEHVCRSGRCQPTGMCLSAGPCTGDQDCGIGDHCAADLTCAPDLPSGQPIPPGHGTCGGNPGNLGTPQSACRSAECNPVSNTCAGPLEAACASDLECVGNSCGADNACGYLAGQGPCTRATAAALCRSGVCSASGAKCIPDAPHSCWNDDECDSAEFCLRDTFSCTAKLAAGSALPADGLHDICAQTTHVSAACASGRCNASSSTCAEDIGAACDAAEDCIANSCQEDGKCGLPDGSGPCTASDAATVCRTRTCGGNGKCSLSNACAEDADCAQGHYCDAVLLTCVPVRLPGAAIPNDRACTTGDAGARPTSSACLGGLCNPITNTCAGANDFGACTAASECSSNTCGNDGRCGRPNGSGPCTGDNAKDVCRSGMCAAASGVCVAEGGCWLDADCGDSQYCDRIAQHCERAIDSGQALPSDGLHAACPSHGMSAACASGLCNKTTNTCSNANSSECSAAAECSSNVCGSNGQCGLANGESGCDLVTGYDLCQTGACTEAGVCGAELTGVPGCAADSECRSSQYCNAMSRTCVKKLEWGEHLPPDGVHTQCVDHHSNACASGNCLNYRCTALSLRGGGLCSAGLVGENKPAFLSLLLFALTALASAWRLRRTRP